MTLRLYLGKVLLGSTSLVRGVVDTAGHRQRLDDSHAWGTGTSPSHQTLPVLRAGPTRWAGVPNLTSWLALRAWISAQTPVIRAMCTANINRPFHQHPAPSPRCGLMPRKPLVWPSSPTFYSPWAGTTLFVCWLNCSQGLPGAAETPKEVPLYGCPAVGGCEHLWGTQRAVHGHGPCTAVGSWPGEVFKANTKCPPFSTSGTGVGAGITWMLPCVRQVLSQTGLSQP